MVGRESRKSVGMKNQIHGFPTYEFWSEFWTSICYTRTVWGTLVILLALSYGLLVWSEIKNCSRTLNLQAQEVDAEIGKVQERISEIVKRTALHHGGYCDLRGNARVRFISVAEVKEEPSGTCCASFPMTNSPNFLVYLEMVDAVPCGNARLYSELLYLESELDAIGAKMAKASQRSWTNQALRCLYVSAMAVTTVGFGDEYPMSRVGKAVCGAQGVIGLTLFGVLVGIMVKLISEEIDNRRVRRGAAPTTPPKGLHEKPKKGRRVVNESEHEDTI